MNSLQALAIAAAGRDELGEGVREARRQRNRAERRLHGRVLSLGGAGKEGCK